MRRPGNATGEVRSALVAGRGSGGGLLGSSGGCMGGHCRPPMLLIPASSRHTPVRNQCGVASVLLCICSYTYVYIRMLMSKAASSRAARTKDARPVAGVWSPGGNGAAAHARSTAPRGLLRACVRLPAWAAGGNSAILADAAGEATRPLWECWRWRGLPEGGVNAHWGDDRGPRSGEDFCAGRSSPAEQSTH